MNTKHTPGPWRVGALVHDIEAADGSLVAELYSRGERYRETGPNARLIAAAPDLLAALRVVARCLPDSLGGVTLGSYEQGIVREAIRKATQP